MFDILLQVDSVTNALPKFDNTLGTLAKGGVLMIPLALLFVAAVFFFIERMIYLRKTGKIEENFMSIIRDNIISGNIASARSLAKNTNNPVARMIDKGIQRIGKPIDTIEKSMDNVGMLEMYKMEKNVSILSIISRVAPLFGFLGTVIGMLDLFKGIAATTSFTPNSIADGIYIKMITTATGLIIGILAYLGYSILNNQIGKIENKMEAASAEFMDILQEPTK
jgi:biopolymer transport protein ExbB